MYDVEVKNKKTIQKRIPAGVSSFKHHFLSRNFSELVWAFYWGRGGSLWQKCVLKNMELSKLIKK
jgi:hypothetical protein